MLDTPITRTEELLLMRQDAIPRGLATAHPIVLARGQGARVWDVEDKEYIDFIGGIGVLNVGHNHPRVVAAVVRQAQQLMHTCFQVAMYEPYIHLARALNRAMPGGVQAKSVLFTSGAEATENAIKIARAYTGRPGVIAFSHSFHGRTLLGMSLTGKANPYKQNFGPFAPEVYRAPYPYEYWGWTTEKALEGLRELFETQVSPDRVAAIIIEPVLGEGGFVPAPIDFLRALRQLCDQHGIVFIDDEIQSGFGRTGKLYAIEHSGVTPDLVTFAKSVGGGLPISGVTGKVAIMDAPQPGGLGGTFGGNVLACAAALAVFDIFEREDLLARGQALGQTLRDAFEAWQRRYPQIGDVRGLGPMLGLEFVSDRQTRQPAPHLVSQIVERARERGLLLLKAGMYGSVIRVLVPLVASDDDIDQALDVFAAALADVLG
ncbi:MAG: 4-aminobutyrate--2-oxoglutarate transaminase [Anaerolineae bacterium]|nr:4-aminobutyrate--2-oxoglutarate transaminase [Anaerolineae bacterium]MDW8171595.1 4-aminobutyrate--2-oxoglutarate transaminase [Anaerolineae bacterium]